MKFLQELLKEAKSYDDWVRDMANSIEDPYSKKNYKTIDSDFRKKRPGFGSKGFSKHKQQLSNISKFHIPKFHITRINGLIYASDDNTYDGTPDGNNYVGHGPTALEAIEDLCDDLIDSGLYSEEECRDAVTVWKHENP